MAPVVRSEIVKATPSTIWGVFEDMKWESWDPDLETVEDVEGGFAEGSTFTFCMKKESGGMKLPTAIKDYKTNETFTFYGKAVGGLMKFEGTFLLETTEKEGETKVTYTFSMMGLLGGLLSTFNKKAVVGGTEGGLANVVRLAEEAAAKK